MSRGEYFLPVDRQIADRALRVFTTEIEGGIGNDFNKGPAELYEALETWRFIRHGEEPETLAPKVDMVAHFVLCLQQFQNRPAARHVVSSTESRVQLDSWQLEVSSEAIAVYDRFRVALLGYAATAEDYAMKMAEPGALYAAASNVSRLVAPQEWSVVYDETATEQPRGILDFPETGIYLTAVSFRR